MCSIVGCPNDRGCAEHDGRQRDAHVRARRALLRRVVNRRLDWGTHARGRGPKLPFDVLEKQLFAAAARALAEYRWHDGWGNKLSRYSPFGERQRVIGIFKDVPADVIHGIMCGMR